MMPSDALRMCDVDAVSFRPISGRSGDKRAPLSSRRFVRPFKTGAVILAACGCEHKASKPGSICPRCGGAELTDDERAR